MIAIIDYGAGNLKSVKNALDKLGASSLITGNPKEILRADRLILPGDGSFGFLMNSLREKRLINPIKEFIKSGKPFLGICLGLQALFEDSEESPGIKGLCLLRGKVIKFRRGKVPQIGWNKIICKKNISSRNIFFGNSYVYFVNSYYADPADKSIALGSSDYYTRFCSAIIWKNVLATQFHPEKSGNAGIEMLRRWIKCLQKE